jgi:GntR family transcriptional regulator / MocR family aminotransferase
MPNRSTFVTLASLVLDPSASIPLYRQLYNALRASVLAGRLKAGARLPATRALAAQFGISRNTVMTAYAQLLAEGYVEDEVGSGTYVARTLPDDLLYARTSATRAPQQTQAGRMLSRRGACWERRGYQRRGFRLNGTLRHASSMSRHHINTLMASR